jgi:hypothetical protein
MGFGNPPHQRVKKKFDYHCPKMLPIKISEIYREMAKRATFSSHW